MKWQEDGCHVWNRRPHSFPEAPPPVRDGPAAEDSSSAPSHPLQHEIWERAGVLAAPQVTECTRTNSSSRVNTEWIYLRLRLHGGAGTSRLPIAASTTCTLDPFSSPSLHRSRKAFTLTCCVCADLIFTAAVEQVWQLLDCFVWSSPSTKTLVFVLPFSGILSANGGHDTVLSGFCLVWILLWCNKLELENDKTFSVFFLDLLHKSPKSLIF